MAFVVLLGLETIKGKNGEPRFAETFNNNYLTWKEENRSKSKTVLIDARDYKDLDDPMSGIFEKLRSVKDIDKLIYWGHSDMETLYMISRHRLELDVNQRFFNFQTDWSGVGFNPNAGIFLYGCRAGGDGRKSETSIAQDIANKTKTTVWAYISKSYQKEYPAGHYHQVSDDKIGFVKFEPLL